MPRLSLILILSSCCIFLKINSQGKVQETFKPSGDIIARSFFDHSTDFDEESGFDITRAFLGYKYRITPNLTGQVVIDAAAGSTSDDRLEVYARNAFLNWSDKKFNINFGLTGLLQFSLQEDYWMHRYVLKSFQDLNSMAPSVDLGITGEYKITDYLSADLSFTNGSGYKKVKKSGSKRYAAGLTVYPLKNIVFRVYGDIYNDSEKLRGELPEEVTNGSYKNQYTLSLFAGYQNEKISSGIEYNKVYNKSFINDKDYFGYSFYSSIKLLPKLRLFARYDLCDSKTPHDFNSAWNDLDGQLMITGVEFQPLKQLKVAPNFRNVNPDRKSSTQYLFINVEFNL